MSLRNELRGPRQNVDDWYYYILNAAASLHVINPKVLVLVSGLNYDLDLSFLKANPLPITLDNKLVYEAHRYAFSNGRDDDWAIGPLNERCDNLIRTIDDLTTFLVTSSNPAPLIISEFGGNLLGTNQGDNNFWACFLVYLAQNDLDWNLWSLHGSYYLRDGQHDFEEQYGLFNTNWMGIRNIETHNKLLSLKHVSQGTNFLIHHIIFFYSNIYILDYKFNCYICNRKKGK